MNLVVSILAEMFKNYLHQGHMTTKQLDRIYQIKLKNTGRC